MMFRISLVIGLVILARPFGRWMVSCVTRLLLRLTVLSSLLVTIVRRLICVV